MTLFYTGRFVQRPGVSRDVRQSIGNVWVMFGLKRGFEATGRGEWHGVLCMILLRCRTQATSGENGSCACSETGQVPGFSGGWNHVRLLYYKPTLEEKTLDDFFSNYNNNGRKDVRRFLQ